MTDQAASPIAKPMGVRDILRIRDYRLLISGQAISDIGDGITFLLLLLVINELTGSTSMLALMAIAEAVPQFTVGLMAGVYVDRWNRRSVMLAADLLRAVIVMAFAVVSVVGFVPLLYVLGFAQSSISTFFRPARGALLPRIVPAEGLPAANSLAQASQVLGAVIGAGIAGLIFSAFGSGVLGFAIDALTFVVSFLLISRIGGEVGRIRAEAHAEQRDMRRSLAEGIAIVRGSRLLTGSLIAAAVSMLGLGARERPVRATARQRPAGGSGLDGGHRVRADRGDDHGGRRRGAAGAAAGADHDHHHRARRHRCLHRLHVGRHRRVAGDRPPLHRRLDGDPAAGDAPDDRPDRLDRCDARPRRVDPPGVAVDGERRLDGDRRRAR
jgi:hypothetical protein